MVEVTVSNQIEKELYEKDFFTVSDTSAFYVQTRGLLFFQTKEDTVFCAYGTDRNTGMIRYFNYPNC